MLDWVIQMFRNSPGWANACAIVVLLLATGAAFRAAAPEQTRALWVTRTTLTSPEAIRADGGRGASRWFQHVARPGARPRRRLLHRHDRTARARARRQTGVRSACHRSRTGAWRRHEGARLGRGESRLELGDVAGLARSRDLSRARMADGAARARRGDEEDRSPQPGLRRAAGPLDPRAHLDCRRPLHLAVASGRAGSHRGGDRRDRREVRRRRRPSGLRAVPERRTSITARRRWNSSRRRSCRT